MSRLDDVAPGLSERIEGQSAPARRALVATVLVAAVRDSGLDDIQALRELEAYIAETARPSRSSNVAEALDAAAWKAQAQGNEERYVALFRQARAASAIAAALDGQVLDAVYEAAHALDDPTKVVPLVG